MGLYGNECDIGFQRFLFSSSFLNELNSHTIFGILPDDVIEIIFNHLKININYVMSPLSYEIKYVSPKLQHPKDNVFVSLQSPHEVWYKDNKETQYNMYDDSMKVNYIAPNTPFGETEFRCIVIENFDFSLIELVRGDLSAQRLMDLYEYLLAEVTTKRLYRSDIQSPFFLMKKLLEGLKNETISMGYVNDRKPDDINWWQEICECYVEDIEDEQGQQHSWMTSHYLEKVGYDKDKKRGELILMYDFDHGGTNLSFHTGMNYFYPRNTFNNDKPTEFYITKSDGEYYIRRCKSITRLMYPPNVKASVLNRKRAKKSFKKLMCGMEVRRERKVMNILRYAHTGIEPSYNVKKGLEVLLMKDIINYRWECNLKTSWYHRKEISETYIYTANIFRINEYIRLKKLYLIADTQEEKYHYIMLMSFLFRQDTRSHLYDVCNKAIANKLESSEDAENTLELYEEHTFLGCDKDSENYMFPQDNPQTYTRPVISIEYDMYKASKSIDGKYGISDINHYYNKMNIFKIGKSIICLPDKKR